MSIKLEVKGRAKYKPAPDFSLEDVQNVLMEKIAEENSLIFENEDDLDVIEKTNYKTDKINVLSLFSGCGGLDLGFELAGLAEVIGEEQAMSAFKDKDSFDQVRERSLFHTIYSNDLFKEANESYKENFPSHVIQREKDIRKVKYFPKCNLILGGFPCPGFSEAGPRLIDDERNFLYIHFIRSLIQAQPEVFVAENVKGLMTLGKGEVLKQIIEDFSSAGYNVQFKLLNARDYGVPQIRERVIIVGVRKDLDFNYKYPAPTHGEQAHLKPYVTLREAIGDLENDPGPYYKGSYSTIFMSRNRKKDWNEQSFTIQASGRQAPIHPGGMPMEKIGPDEWIFSDGEENNRRLSVKEVARIQTFPDWFVFSDGGNNLASLNSRIDKQYKQIGNAVPVLLAKAIAEPIAKWAKQYIDNNQVPEPSKDIQLDLF
ncbi:DNA (cytosine-5)-methyltransferase 1 [Bhargavaea beijingensis]|uniref:Cytosine-specific methyltransferase n=1 Tax=Bhargavaea beijingensis TaxID=426756 RepID=A0A1G6XL33_9BACL|nr:DNA cytosine methyltransferase [Bhargavaea beijingensis]SDD78731.1 DNA (cytosine-5)-methyltransferase 1 [Bhargavaea beijingensis]